MIAGPASQQRFCATFLETLGLSVTVAEDFRDGARGLAGGGRQLVILDARTQGFDPQAWSRLLDAATARPRVFVVIDEGAPDATREIEADGFIQRRVRALDLVMSREIDAKPAQQRLDPNVAVTVQHHGQVKEVGVRREREFSVRVRRIDLGALRHCRTRPAVDVAGKRVRYICNHT